MAAAPVVPPSTPSPTPQPEGLSEPARIINVFIAPSKTFTDLRRSAMWWAPFLLMAIVSTIFVYTVGAKIGFRKVAENQVQMSPKQAAQLDNMQPDQREKQMEARTTGTRIFSYFFPVVLLIIMLIFAALMLATFKFGAGADLSFKVALAVVIYGGLPGLLRTLLALLSVAAGMSPDSFSFQNPVATNPGYFLNPADSVFLYSIASALDIFTIWSLVVTAIGFACVTKVKQGTSYAIVFGWWIVTTLFFSGVGAMFS